MDTAGKLRDTPDVAATVAGILAGILTGSLGVPADRITPEARLVEDLEISSLDRIELIFELESAFEIEIPDEAIVEVRTLGDIAGRIEAALAQRE